MTAFLIFLATVSSQMIDVGFLSSFPGDTVSTEAYAVSDDGRTAVGISGVIGRPFRWTASGGIARLGTEDWGYAYGVSGDGRVAVGKAPGNATNVVPCKWTNGGPTTVIGDLAGGGLEGFAYDASYDGSVIVGGERSLRGMEPFRWSESGGMVGLGLMAGSSPDGYANGVSADGSVVVGEMRGNPGQAYRGFVWTQASGVVFLNQSTGYTVSGDGQVVAGDRYIFNRTLGTTTESASYILSLDGTGLAAVGVQGFRCGVWDRTGGDRDFEAAIILEFGIDTTGWSQFYQAAGISADGRHIVGWGVGPRNARSGFVVTLPRPLGGGGDCVPGDTNGDGQVSGADVPAFVQGVLAGEPGPDCTLDVTPDGRLDGRDVQAFTALLR